MLSVWPPRLKTKVLQSFCCALYHARGTYGQNHYATLGIPTTATLAEVKSAYFNLCKEYHPDRHSNNKVKSEKFLRISDAYTVLSNVESRREYDVTLTGLPPPHHRDQHRQERWSSAYRNNPHVRYRRQKQGQEQWDDYFNARRKQEHWNDYFNARQRTANSYHQWDPKENLNRYWDEFYRHQSQGSRHGTFSGGSTPTWLSPDRLVSFIFAFVVTMLVMRFMAASAALRSRSTMEQFELDRHMEVYRQADEAKGRLTEARPDEKSM